MRKSLFPVLMLLLLLSACKTDEEKLTKWATKEPSEWLVREMSYDYVRVQQSTVQDAGIEINNGYFMLNENGTGSVEFFLGFLGGNLATPFDWTTDGVKLYGDAEGVGAGGGTYVFYFEMEKTSKNGASMTAQYDYVEPGLTEDFDMEIRLTRK